MKNIISNGKLLTFDYLINSVFNALAFLGGSGSIEEIYETVIEMEKFDESVISIRQNPEKSNQTVLDYELGWARSYLKKCGLFENSSRGVWSLTPLAKEQKSIDALEVIKTVRKMSRATSKQNQNEDDIEIQSVDTPEEIADWKDELYLLLTKQISPDAFERLTQRLLRECGFVQVEVTGKTGDGGIDGKGIARINGLMSFHVIFQCKKYQGSVSASEMRDFRGAMVGRADKGLFITTGTFTPSAIKEATRDGAPPIDLIDGEHLAEKLKELQLGVKTEMVEKVTINSEWFLSL
ncbi:MAG: restriction endonuclease [Methylococcaceae bacterium]|jgi:restriction system protein